MRGSVLLTFDEAINDLGFDGITINVAGQERYIRFIDSSRIYTTPINTGEVCSITLSATPSPQLSSRILVNRIDYTTDDVSGDNGVKQTYIGEDIVVSGGTSYSFTATTRPDAYGFEYKIECYTDGCFPNNAVAFNGQVYDVEAQPDGKILCSGIFTQYSGTSVNNICRLNADGTLDTTFNYTQATSGFGVGDMKLLPDGDIIARIQSFRVGKIKSNGQLDTTFNIGSFNIQISSEEEVIEIQSDGKILFSGGFSTYTSAGQTSTKTAIVRLNPNGTIDTTFNQFGTGFTTNAIVRDICIQPDGKILVAGGTFNTYNGVTLNSPGLIRLNPDGSLDTSFIRNTSTNVDGWEVEILSDGKIMFYNDSGGYNGDTNKKLVRLNPDGSLDTSFPNTALSLSPTLYKQVADILVDHLDRTYICGTSLVYSGVTVPSLTRLNSDGTADSTFSDGNGFGTINITIPGQPRALTLTKTGSLYVGGTFIFYYNLTTISQNIMKIRNNGTPFLC
jgi:uncharacterized delta-60 repeat protein